MEELLEQLGMASNVMRAAFFAWGLWKRFHTRKDGQSKVRADRKELVG